MTEGGAVPILLHATCVAIDGRGVLITGPSGAGKSDLALRLIDRGARLVADDCTLVRVDGSDLLARAPANIAGQIEVRGIGIVTMSHVDDVPVRLAVALGEPVERLPKPGATRPVAGIPIDTIALAGFEASAPVKVKLALDREAGENGP
jgi:serine kinase of HPr protein (carbohydrate metabolism regulator)